MSLYLMKPPQEKPTTFDRYAGDYAALIQDPIRKKFAVSNRFFFEQKVHIIRRFFRAAGIQSENLGWLDIGCGQGDLLYAGRPYFKSAVGCDPSEGMLQACMGLDVRKQQSSDKLPFDDASFDFITIVCVFHHVQQHERPRLTREALRVLKPGGYFCVIEHNPWNPVTRLIVSRSPVDADARLLSAQKVCHLLLGAKSRILATHYFLIFPEAIHRYFGRIEDMLSWLPFGGQYAVFARRST